jgi:hypothetical protein
MDDDRVAKNHISNMPGCEPDKFQVKEMKRDQSWKINGNYDYSKRDGNLEKMTMSEDCFALQAVIGR